LKNFLLLPLETGYNIYESFQNPKHTPSAKTLANQKDHLYFGKTLPAGTAGGLMGIESKIPLDAVRHELPKQRRKIYVHKSAEQ
jgi:hypothetical protein